LASRGVGGRGICLGRDGWWCVVWEWREVVVVVVCWEGGGGGGGGGKERARGAVYIAFSFLCIYFFTLPSQRRTTIHVPFTSPVYT